MKTRRCAARRRVPLQASAPSRRCGTLRSTSRGAVTAAPGGAKARRRARSRSSSKVASKSPAPPPRAVSIPWRSIARAREAWSSRRTRRGSRRTASRGRPCRAPGDLRGVLQAAQRPESSSRVHRLGNALVAVDSGAGRRSAPSPACGTPPCAAAAEELDVVGGFPARPEPREERLVAGEAVLLGDEVDELAVVSFSGRVGAARVHAAGDLSVLELLGATRR